MNELANQKTTISINSGRKYDVIVGYEISNEILSALGNSVNKIIIIHQAIMHSRAEALRDKLLENYEQVILAEVPDAEKAKRVEVAAFCWSLMAQNNFTRTDAVIGLGGGAATDLAGFVAATCLRGVKLIQVPTTVAAMVDAAIGGKTGINIDEGKNLVGSFYAPHGVIVDLEYLKTLGINDIRAGFAEIVKAGFIRDENILHIIEHNPEIITKYKDPKFFELIVRAIKVKADIVSNDFTESGEREFLNYGHTLGHAIEYSERYQWRHGVAVAIGMIFAAELAALAGKISEELVQRHRKIIGSILLPTNYRADMWHSLIEAMYRDKKTRGNTLRFVILTDVAKPAIYTVPDEHILFSAYQEII